MRLPEIMRLMIDGTSLLLSSAGVKTHLYYWIENLRRIECNNQVTLFPYIDSWRSLDHLHSHLSPAATQLRLAFVRFTNLARNNLLNSSARGQDLFHASQHLMNPPTNVRLTATFYDATVWLLPETHTRENIVATKRNRERVLKKADGIIAISESTRNDAIRVLRLPEHKIHCIYPSVPDMYFDADAASIARASNRYHLQKPYLLCVGAIEPRKNLGRLLDAYAALPKSLREEFDLVVAGSAMWRATAVLQKMAGIAGVRYLGYVPEPDLPGLTAGAYGFIYPSLYEGFGLPLAQAIAAGVPAITSRTSSLPEVGGQAALYIDPMSVDELRGAMQRLMLSPELRASLAAKARGHAEQFRWQRNAAQSWEFFERL